MQHSAATRVPATRYRDSDTLALAAKINEFVRAQTDDPTIASVALEASLVTLSFVERSDQPSVAFAALRSVSKKPKSVSVPPQR